MNTEECRNLLRTKADRWREGRYYQRDDMVYDINHGGYEGAVLFVFTFYKTTDTHTAKERNHPILNPTLWRIQHALTCSSKDKQPPWLKA